LAVSVLTILLQVLVTARMIRWFGIGSAVAAQPFVVAFCFVALSFFSSLTAIAVSQTLSRGFNFGISNPARHILFSNVTIDEKYKAKNVIDTLVQRGGDAIGGWAFVVLATAAGFGLSVISIVAVPAAAFWFGLSIGLARMQKKLTTDHTIA
jgi:AAA family ATP:ADP antiporter